MGPSVPGILRVFPLIEFQMAEAKEAGDTIVV
jgi:hypothetical protein